MKKRILLIIPVVLFLLTGCTIFRNTMDKKTGFSTELTALEGHIVSENWEEAGKSALQANKKWIKVKPWMQLEIDHDIINEIETKLTELSAYLETEEKSAALANIRVIINAWEDIGSK